MIRYTSIFMSQLFQIYQFIDFLTSTACILILLSNQNLVFSSECTINKALQNFFFKLSSLLESATLHCLS